MTRLRMLSYKEKKNVGNLLKDLVPSINTSQIQGFREHKGYKRGQTIFNAA